MFESLRRVLNYRIPGYVVKDLLFFHDPKSDQRPTWWRVATAIGVALISIAFVSVSDDMAPPRTLTWSDKHRNASLEIALNRVLCGTDSRLSSAYSVAEQLEAHPELGDVALPALAARLAGSAGEYCRSVTRPFLNAENSLMLEMDFFLAIDRQLSLRGLGWCLQATRVLALIAFAWALVENGASLAFAGGVLSLGLGILGFLGGTSYYSVYPFLPVLLVLTAALLSLSLQRALPLSNLSSGVTAGMAGLLIAFAVNMRTSHLPIYLAFLALYFTAALRAVQKRREAWPPVRQLRWLATGVVSATLCYGLFGFALLRPLSRDGTAGFSNTYHPIAHALVLGLAVPESSLSRREGIEWEDQRGLALARRVDPHVQYLRQGYERALLTYYRQLWTRYPGEMLEVYLGKLQVSGRSMLSKLSSSPIGPVAWPLSWPQSGIVLLFVYGLVFTVFVTIHLRLGSPLAFTLALLSAAGVLLQLESTLVYSVFDMTHHSSQLLVYLVLNLVAWQSLLEGARIVGETAWHWQDSRKRHA